MKSFLRKLSRGENWKENEIHQVFEVLLSPETSDEEIRDFLLALASYPVDAHWLTAAAQVLRAKAVPVDLKVEGAMDTAGTGGSKTGAFNFSTAAALLAAACGVPVAKHGNRSISSQSGSADLLEALGVSIEMGPQEVVEAVTRHRFAFMMAPRFHPATFRVQKIRRELSQVTVFNFLGPLLNPARVSLQVVGVAQEELRPVMAEALRRLGTERAWVVHGEGGLDEMSLAGKTWVSEVTPQGIEEKEYHPQDGVLRSCELQYLKGGDGRRNAQLLWGIFENSFFGPLLGGVLWNTAAALVVAGKAQDLKEGVAQARLAIENGAALALLKALGARPSQEETSP